MLPGTRSSPSSHHRRHRPHRRHRHQSHHHVPEEGLAHNFRETPWLPPSESRAKQYRNEMVFNKGKANLWGTPLVDVAELGVGVSLYFNLVRGLAFCFLMMSFVTIPSMILVANGKRLKTESVVLGSGSSALTKWTIANVDSGKATRSSAACVAHHIRLGLRALILLAAPAILSSLLIV